jgi:hypothetical protein
LQRDPATWSLGTASGGGSFPSSAARYDQPALVIGALSRRRTRGRLRDRLGLNERVALLRKLPGSELTT